MTLRRSPMPPRAVPLLRSSAMPPDTPLARSGFRRHPGLSVVRPDGAEVLVLPEGRRRRKDPITPKVRKLVHARDAHWCVRCGTFCPDGIELHHRRIKGIGGSTAEHAHCACAIVSLDASCHRDVHLNRIGAEAEGLIIPRAAEFPFLYSVLVHGCEDGSGAQMWPTCDGRWMDYGPEGAVT